MPSVDYTSPDLWNHLRQRTHDLVAAYQAACQQPGEPGQDAAWRCLMTDILDAVADAGDGDPLAAVNALEEALLDTGDERGIVDLLR
jgi:hypothetical protein